MLLEVTWFSTPGGFGLVVKTLRMNKISGGRFEEEEQLHFQLENLSRLTDGSTTHQQVSPLEIARTSILHVEF